SQAPGAWGTTILFQDGIGLLQTIFLQGEQDCSLSFSTCVHFGGFVWETGISMRVIASGNPQGYLTLASNNWAAMLYWLYARLLMRQITVLPGHVCFMISGQDLAEAPENLYHVTAWCNEISAQVSRRTPGSTGGIRSLMFHIATPSSESLEQ